jgi:cbb3-type cytochrome oxidase maturation protein
MNILFFIIPLSALIAAVGVAAFLLANRNGQFDDLETPAYRILDDDFFGDLDE